MPETPERGQQTAPRNIWYQKAMTYKSERDALRARLAAVEAALRRLMETDQTDDDGDVTLAWNEAYVAARAVLSEPVSGEAHESGGRA